MPREVKELLAEIADYYSAKLAEHGESPKGVDWNTQESQNLRFEQLSKIINPVGTFSLNDLGCGYGALYDFLNLNSSSFSYCGIDVSAGMIRASQQRYFGKNNVRFLVGSEPSDIADYGIASGIFNVRLGRSDDEWWDYVEITLDALDRTSRLGFTFNCLTSYSDPDKIRDYLYYANPCKLFDFCKKRYSKNVALLHDYGLYEFTVHVRKML